MLLSKNTVRITKFRIYSREINVMIKSRIYKELNGYGQFLLNSSPYYSNLNSQISGIFLYDKIVLQKKNYALNFDILDLMGINPASLNTTNYETSLNMRKNSLMHIFFWNFCCLRH